MKSKFFIDDMSKFGIFTGSTNAGFKTRKKAAFVVPGTFSYGWGII